MKQKLHSLIALLLVAVLTAGLLCGCHKNAEKSSDKTSNIESASTADSNSKITITSNPDEKSSTPAASSKASEGSASQAEAPTKDNTSSASSKVTESSASQAEAPTKESTPASFTACSISTAQLGAFRYWLYTPSDPAENMPLIVYLHGGSGKGDDLDLITAVDGFPQYLQSGKLGDVRAYVIIPQLPSTQKGWVNAAEAIVDLIEQTVSTYKIDRNSISLTGHSMGGTGTWNLACTYPTLFARIAPLSGSIRNMPDIIDKLKSIPIQAFVGSADTIVPPDSSKEVVAALKAAGGSAEITVFDGADHFSVPSLTFLDTNIDLIGWLIGG